MLRGKRDIERKDRNEDFTMSAGAECSCPGWQRLLSKVSALGLPGSSLSGASHPLPVRLFIIMWMNLCLT